MKLTLAQITIIQSALAEHGPLLEGRAQRAGLGDDQDFWQQEAANARALETLFKDALSVEVKSVNLCAPPTVRRARKPPLLITLEAAQTTIDRRDILRSSSPAEKRALARHLGIPANDLMDWATTQRMRAA